MNPPPITGTFKVSHTANNSLMVIACNIPGIDLSVPYGLTLLKPGDDDGHWQVHMYQSADARIHWRDLLRDGEIEFRCRHDFPEGFLPMFNQCLASGMVTHDGAICIDLPSKLPNYKPRQRAKVSRVDPVLQDEVHEAIATLNRALKAWPDLQLEYRPDLRMIEGRVNLLFQ